MVIWASDFDPLNQQKPILIPMSPGPAPVNSIGIASQTNEYVHLYKDYKKVSTYCESRIILISVITNKCP